MLFFSQQQSVKKIQQELKNEQEKALKLEQKFDLSKEEFRKNKEELERKRTELQEFRELNKKKLKRLKESELSMNQDSEANMSDRILDETNKTVLALEAMIESLKNEHEKEKANMQNMLQQDIENKQKEHQKNLEVFKADLNKLQEELKKQKRLNRPEGCKIDLKQLPDEAASEFARLFRKAQQHERLHGVARAKLHLAQEKFTTLQKRYFEVCRELALAMGKNEASDPVKARDLAEEVMAKHHTGDSDNNGKRKICCLEEILVWKY